MLQDHLIISTDRPGTIASTPPFDTCAGHSAGSYVLSVVIPVFNESQRVATLLRRVLASPVPKQILCIDDGSTDGSADLIRGFVSADLSLICHRQNFGKGAAIRTALRFATGDFVLIQDADLEYDPDDYASLLAPLVAGRANVVYGVRHDDARRGLRYFIAARLLTRATNLLFGSNLSDVTTCYKVFRRSVLDNINLECQGFEFCFEVTAKLLRSGEAIAEAPISYRPRGRRDGKKVRWTDAVWAIWTLCRHRLTPARHFRRDAFPTLQRYGDSFITGESAMATSAIRGHGR